MVRTAAVVAMAAIACGSGAPPARDTPSQGPPPMTVPDPPEAHLMRRLIDHPPARLSELEAITGPIAMSFRDEDRENTGWLSRPRDGTGEFTPAIPRLSVRYRFDMYHEAPDRVRDVSLETYTLVVRGDAEVAERVLRERLGAPRTVAERGTTYAAVHPFYIARESQPTDRFRLVWYREVPRFAIPTPDPAAREVWLRGLAKRIATARSVDEIDAYCKSASPDAGIEITGTLNRTANPYGRPANDGRDFWIKLVPPVRAVVVAAAFEWGAVVGVSHDVHMSSWHLERRTDEWFPTSGADDQWQIAAALRGSPSGAAVTRGTSRGLGVREVTVEDELTSLSIAPRFK